MSRRGALLVIASLLASCWPDSVPFGITLVMQRGETNQCSSDSCNSIEMSCNVAVLVRIADLSNEIAYVSECAYIEGGGDLCAIGDVELPREMVPNQTSRLQIAVWRELDLQAHDDLNGTRFVADGTCPQVTFNVQGQPAADPTPVLGGESYFRVGSKSTASVTVHCLDDEALNAPECQGFESHFVATAFELSDMNLLPVGQSKADDLDVGAVEPAPALVGAPWEVDPDDVVPLVLTQISPIPLWDALLSRPFERVACVQIVDESVTIAVTSIECVEADDPMDPKDGMLVPTEMLDRVEVALGIPIPPGGIVLGVVVNAAGQPAADVVVSPDLGTVQYLSEDLTSTRDQIGVPLTRTTSSGAFVSTDAVFGSATTLNEWTALHISGNNEQKAAIGGLVRGKVTVVKIQLKPDL
jgi:hypothetical protein